MNTQEVQTLNNVENDSIIKATRNYKDTLFRMIFKEPAELLQLYNAVNETNYTNPADLEIVTLENAIYLNMKNDVAFIIGCYLNMYEQQSSFNPNMPLRYLQYVAREYEKLIADKTIYTSKLLKVPTPNFIVFYNGTADLPERMELKLSDAFEIYTEHPALELCVIQLNINSGHSQKLMEQCKTLREYALYVDRVRQYTADLPLQQAVEKAVQECIHENILTKFLTRYKAEAISMSIFEYDEEKELALIRQAEKEVGWEEGHAEGLSQGLTEGRTKGLAEGRAEGLAEGLAEGRAEGLRYGINAFILDNLNENIPRERILEKLMKHFQVTQEQASTYIENCHLTE